MSEENVEIVRAAVEATMRRPRPDWETMNASSIQTTSSLAMWGW